jgi:hypothetical protein
MIATGPTVQPEKKLEKGWRPMNQSGGNPNSVKTLAEAINIVLYPISGEDISDL